MMVVMDVFSGGIDIAWLKGLFYAPFTGALPVFQRKTESYRRQDRLIESSLERLVRRVAQPGASQTPRH